MAKQVTKEMLIGEILQLDPQNGAGTDGQWNALHRLPLFPGRVSGGGCYGSRNRSGAAGRTAERISESNRRELIGQTKGAARLSCGPFYADEISVTVQNPSPLPIPYAWELYKAQLLQSIRGYNDLHVLGEIFLHAGGVAALNAVLGEDVAGLIEGFR